MPRPLVVSVDTRAFHGHGYRFRPNGKLLRYGTEQEELLRKNPIKHMGVATFAARLIMGFNVGHKKVWALEPVIEMVKNFRIHQGLDPDSTFFATKGLYTSTKDGSIVEEDGCQVVILHFGDQIGFEKQIIELAEFLVEEMEQETIIVELQKNGIPYDVLGVTEA